ncbi:class IIb bacteriocin, lactobin A/cerein 7B family [Ningiella sp. W23]|uniref:class IIb bacteriocin, lactobin A/cerein 7B family n=1 Tax=Ningiella sp. W23 TaxID=3023715 RepID=UPI003756F5C0
MNSDILDPQTLSEQEVDSVHGGLGLVGGVIGAGAGAVFGFIYGASREAFGDGSKSVRASMASIAGSVVSSAVAG